MIFSLQKCLALYILFFHSAWTEFILMRFENNNKTFLIRKEMYEFDCMVTWSSNIHLGWLLISQAFRGSIFNDLNLFNYIAFEFVIFWVINYIEKFKGVKSSIESSINDQSFRSFITKVDLKDSRFKLVNF